MKRSVDTFRKILLQIEARPNGEVDNVHPIDGISDADLHGHVELLVEGGTSEPSTRPHSVWNTRCSWFSA